MTIDLENVRDDDLAIFNTIRQVVCNPSVYAPDVELALIMDPYLYRRLKEAVPMNAGNPSQLYGLPVYVYKSLPPELFYLVPEYVAQAWAKAETEWLASLGGGRT